MRVSPHLVRAPFEPVNKALEEFYTRTLSVLRMPLLREGEWRLCECRRAWDDNGTSDNFVAFSWHGPSGEFLLVTVNYAETRSQCYVRLPFEQFQGRIVELRDVMGTARYERDSRGLYLDLYPWGYHVFEVR